MQKTVAIPSYITALGTQEIQRWFNLMNAEPIGTNTLSGNNVLVEDLNSTNIGNIIGSSSHQSSVLCQAPGINPWSVFKPNGSAPYTRGSFACYNKNAKPPTYFASHPAYDISQAVLYYIQSDTVHMHCDCILRRGEGLPTYGNSSDRWNNLEVDFELYATNNSLIRTVTVTGVNIVGMYNSTLVMCNMPVDSNTITRYKMKVKAYYTDNYQTRQQLIEDSELYYYIWSVQYTSYTPATAAEYSDYSPYASEPAAVDGQWNWSPYFHPVSSAAYQPRMKLEYKYYAYPDGYPSLNTWYADAPQTWISGETPVRFEGVSKSQTDTRYGRSLDIWFYDNYTAAWVLCFQKTW